MIKSNKGQIALEALVIFGILVVGSIIFGLFYMNNVRDILVEGPGTKQDKNGGGDIYDDLEGSLVYNEEDQIGSSSFGMTGGSGSDNDGTDNPDDPDDPDDPDSTYCGDGTCNGGESPVSCPQDCGAPTYGTLNLNLIPEYSTEPNNYFGIRVSMQTNASNLIIKSVAIRDEYGFPTSNCGYDGVYNPTFENLGTLELLSEDPTVYGLTKDFICHYTGTYLFYFIVSPQDNLQTEFTRQINKEISEPPMQFISVWNTDFEGSALSESDEIILPVISTGTYDFDVDWGDGITSHISNDDPRIPLYYFDGVNNEYIGPAKHQYARPGIYTVAITGTIDGFNFVRPDLMYGMPLDAKKLIEISQWGPLRLGNTGNNFFGAENLVITATDLLDTSDITNMSNMFYECRSLIEVPRINDWNTTNVRNMSGMFYYDSSFNQLLSFDTSNVTDMSRMFSNAFNFNSPLSFNTSNVRNMSGMFFGASSFNQPLSFNTSNVTDMSAMFSDASSFNQPLSFNTINVTNMNNMFMGATTFNSTLDFDTSNVINMNNMFYSASSFNKPLQFNTSNVISMTGMFYAAINFNQSINNWNTSSVKNMSYMFGHATSFDKSLNLDTSSVTDMSWMFNGASSFNSPLEFDTSEVTNMYYMFSNAIRFNQNISTWNVDNVLSWDYIFDNCPIQSDYKPSKFR